MEQCPFARLRKDSRLLLVCNWGFRILIHIWVWGIQVCCITNHNEDLHKQLRIQVSEPWIKRFEVYLAMSDTVGLFTNSNALWAVFCFTSFIRTFDLIRKVLHSLVSRTWRRIQRFLVLDNLCDILMVRIWEYKLLDI